MYYCHGFQPVALLFEKLTFWRDFLDKRRDKKNILAPDPFKRLAYSADKSSSMVLEQLNIASHFFIKFLILIFCAEGPA